MKRSWRIVRDLHHYFRAAEYSGEQPRHGDIWRRCHTTSQFTVMHVCGHHNPPHVTGYWWTDGEVDPCAHASYPLPRFLAAFEIIDRPTLDGWP